MKNPGDLPPISGTSQGPNWSDLRPRLISAAVLIVVTVVALAAGGFLFAAVVGAVFAGAYREWETMVLRRALAMSSFALIGIVALAGLAFPLAGWWGILAGLVIAVAVVIVSREPEQFWRVGGVAFFLAVVGAAVSVRGSTFDGVNLGVYLGTVVWATDSAAFFSGRLFGGEKLAPEISPSKTWSGAIGGLVVGTLVGTLLWFAFGQSPLWIGIAFSALLSVLAQAGDLLESAIKRNFRIKDSGDIIPGHGGLMDRLDSITFGLLFVFLVGLVHAGFNLSGVASGFLHW